MITHAKELSNIRGISFTDTGSGAVVGVTLAGTPDMEASLESLNLKVHIEYREKHQKEIDVMVKDALEQALQAIQHEINLCRAKAATAGKGPVFRTLSSMVGLAPDAE